MSDFKLPQDKITKYKELGIMDEINDILNQNTQATSKELKIKLEESEKARTALEQQTATQQQRQTLLAEVPERNRSIVNTLIDSGRKLDELKNSNPELFIPFKPINEVITQNNPENIKLPTNLIAQRDEVIKLGKAGTGKTEDLAKVAEAIAKDPTILDEINR